MNEKDKEIEELKERLKQLEIVTPQMYLGKPPIRKNRDVSQK